MKLSKCFKQAFGMVVHSRLRSWLTILGIVIGVAAVIAIVSLSEGMQQSLNERLGGLGSDILTLNAGFSRGGGFEGRAPQGGGGSAKATDKQIVLDRTDVQALKGIPEIAYIDTNIRGTVNVSYLGKSGQLSLTGVDQKVWSKITTSVILQGRLLDSADQNVIVIGKTLSESYFDQPIGINKMINIEGNAFRVVGILDDESRGIYMPIQMAFNTIPNKDQNVYDSITIKVKDEKVLDETIAKIENKLMISRHVTSKNKDFSITSSKQMQETIAQTMNSVSLFLIAIAAVSLIVGAVGIANTMFTSVLEKTKEIGIMKAIGARNRDILLIFLLNSALIGLVGGVLGILFGSILSGLMSSLISGSLPTGRGMSSIVAIVSLNSIFMAVGVSITVGIIAGIIPAYKASKLKPVDALRYE